MKLEYFESPCQDCPLILIYGNEMVGASNLRLAIERVASGLTNHIDIHEIPGYNPVDDCQLRLQITQNDAVGVRMDGKNCFVWELTLEDCYDVIGLLEPFSDKIEGNTNKHYHQYLEQNGEFIIIFSTDRQW